MALKKCPKCAEKIQAEALICRFCGTDQPKVERQTVGAGAIVGASVAVFLIVMFCSSQTHKPAETAKDTNAADKMEEQADALEKAADKALAEADRVASPTSPWSYSKSKDEVRGRDIIFASSASTNQIDFDFPYSGGSTLTVNVRKHPAYGIDVYFTVSSGQMLCNTYDGCYATVRFDNKSVKRFSLNEPSDHSSETVFVKGAQRFIQQMASAKKMVVELEFYQAGRPQFSFDISNLHWPPQEKDF